MKRALRVSPAILAFFAASILPSYSVGAGFPDRPITIVVGSTAGGPTDVIARVTAEGLSKRLNQSVIVANRPGANSAIGFNSFVRSNPDGYTLFVMTALTSSLPLMQQNFAGEPVDSVEAISLLAMNSIAVVARGNAPFNTLPEMIAYAKANPEKMTYATVGGLPELLARYVFLKQGARATYIPYKGAADLTTDLVAERIDVGFFSLVGIGGFLGNGRLKVVAATGRSRSPLRPNVATLAETIPGLELEDINYFGLVAPKGTPADVLSVIHSALIEVGQSEEFKSKIRGLESTPVTSSPEDFRKLMETVKNWKVMAREVGFEPK